MKRDVPHILFRRSKYFVEKYITEIVIHLKTRYTYLIYILLFANQIKEIVTLILIYMRKKSMFMTLAFHSVLFRCLKHFADFIQLQHVVVEEV